MVELYINDKLVDLKGDEDISVEYKIFDIKDIGSRNGARSYAFQLPKTNRNKEVFESPEILDNESTLPYSRFKVRCYVDGVDTLILFGELQSAKEYYNVRLYGTNSNIFDAIRDESIRTLDLSQYNHTRNIYSILVSSSNGEGYVYPIIDFHADSPNSFLPGGPGGRECAAEFMLPCTFVKTLLTKIFNEIGYGIDLTEYNNEPVVLCPTTNVQANPVLPVKYNGVFSYSQNITFDGIVLFIIYTGTDIFEVGEVALSGIGGTAIVSASSPMNTSESSVNLIEWSGQGFEVSAQIEDTDFEVLGTIISVTQTPATNPIKFITIDTVVNYSGDYFTMPQPPDVAFHFDDDIPCSIVITLRVRNDSVYTNFIDVIVVDPVGDMLVIEKTIAIQPLSTLVKTISINSGQAYLEYGSGVVTKVFELNYNGGDVKIGYQAYSSAVTVLNTTTYEVQSGIVDEQPMPWVYNTRVELNATLPDIDRLDLVKMYCQMFCLLLFVDEVNKVVKFVPFRTIKDNIGVAYDWSDKIDYSEEPEVTFILDGYTQNNKFTYKQQGDIEKPTEPDFEQKPEGTDGAIIINNKNLEAESEYVDLPFAASLDVRRFISSSGGTFIPPIMVNQIGLFSAGEFANEKEPRILIVDRTEFPNITAPVDIPFAINFTNPETTNYYVMGWPVTRFIHTVGRNNAGDPGRSYNLGWDNSLLPVQYGQINSILSKSKLLSILVRLSISDINQLDFTIPVYIDKYDSYFYINSVKDFSFNNSKSSIVELIKLNIV